jgi:hypothetical protein
MSDNRTNSGNTIRLKKLTTFLLIVVGGLGLIKAAIEYIHTTIENRDIMLATERAVKIIAR